MKVLPLPSRPYLICSIVLPCALATPGRGQMTRVRTSLLTRRLKREKERCEDKPLGNTYPRESKDKPEKGPEILRAEKESGHDSVPE